MNSVTTFLKMIKIEHSLFALPFAFTGMLLAARGFPSWQVLFWIAVAMVGARSGGMGLNRVIDADIDARNPRTANREIPAGKISKKLSVAYIVVSFALFVWAAWMLNPLCLYLSPVPIAVFVLYAYAKRFTALCHVVLGFALGLAPIGAWVAVTGSLSGGILLLGLAVLLWVAGFDVLYALQDIDFDREEGLHSIPRFLGIRKSLMLARLLHLVAFLLFAYCGILFGLGVIYMTGIALCGGFMIYEHLLVRENDLSRLDMAFFTINAYISLTICIFTLIDLMVFG